MLFAAKNDIMITMTNYLIDTHCHLHDQEWFSPAQAAECLENAHAAGVEQIVVIGTDPVDSVNAQKFAVEHENVYWTYGIHPEYSNHHDVSKILRLVDWASWQKDSLLCEGGAEAAAEHAARESREDGRERRDPSKDGEPFRAAYPVAIGEIGLDYHYEGYDRNAQIRLFEQMLQLAVDLNLPVSLHLREAFADAWAVLANFPTVRGVVHSFTGSKKELRIALERGFYIGVNGLVTYTTPPIPPLERILLETDAPFLTPKPYRDTIKTNQPSYVKAVAACLAEKMGVAESTISEQTTQNARSIFRI